MKPSPVVVIGLGVLAALSGCTTHHRTSAGPRGGTTATTGRSSSAAASASVTGEQPTFCASLKQDWGDPGASGKAAAKVAAQRFHDLEKLAPAGLRKDVVALSTAFGEVAAIAGDQSALKAYLTDTRVKEITDATDDVRAYLDSGCAPGWSPPAPAS
jgi:hypothetical protein